MRQNNQLTANSSIKDAIRVIESTYERLAIVFSSDGLVLGTLTDGDVRRAILNGVDISDNVLMAMNSNPITAKEDSSRSMLDKLLKEHNIRSILLLDSKNKFVKTYAGLHGDSQNPQIPNNIDSGFSFAVIMAGGEGARLRPITSAIPKPMVDINGTPLLERQIIKLKDIGIKKIYISVNYLGNIIREYFENGEKWGVEIYYLNERKKLGTAGALSLIKNINSSRSFLVMNGDILTSSNFLNLYRFHEERKSQITIGAINYHVRIPYGVINHKEGEVLELKEKPVESYFCNAGIYALSSDILQSIPKDTRWDMTDLIGQLLSDEGAVSVFPVHEYWSDIGTPSDLEEARRNAKELGL